MRTLAFTFSTNDLEYVVLEWTKENPILHSKKRISLPANYDTPQTTSWFETQLELLLNNIQPERVTYRLSIMKVTNAYVSNVYYWQGILNLLCHKRNIPITHTSPSSIKASKFGQPKETNLTRYIENLLGKQTAPWDKWIKDTALIALINLQ